MHLHAQLDIVFFNSRHSVTKMRPSEHQVLPVEVQGVKAVLQAAGHLHTPLMLDGADKEQTAPLATPHVQEAPWKPV